MDVKETIRQFLPKYLSPEEEDKLVDCINEFPANINTRFYTTYLKDEPTVFQGDGILSLPIIDLPNSEIKSVPCLILSNTCDTDEHNGRLFPSRLNYSQIIPLSKYINALHLLQLESERIQNNIKAIKIKVLHKYFIYHLQQIFLNRLYFWIE